AGSTSGEEEGAAGSWRCWVSAGLPLRIIMDGQPESGTQRGIRQRLEAEGDEFGSLIGRKANRHWGWIAMEAMTRLIIAFYVGTEAARARKPCRERFRQSIKNRPCSILIVTKSIRVSSLQHNTGP